MSVPPVKAPVVSHYPDDEIDHLPPPVSIKNLSCMLYLHKQEQGLLSHVFAPSWLKNEKGLISTNLYNSY